MCVVTTSIQGQTVLLIPDSANSRVSAFSPVAGSMIDLNFIPDDGPLGNSTLDDPRNAIGSGRGTIFVSDEDADAVFEYGFDGNLIGTFADATQGLGGVRGIAVNGDSLYVNSTAGTDSVQEFNLVTGVQSTWTTTNLASQIDIHFRDNDVLISNFFSDNVERYDLDGNFLSTFVDGNGTDGVDFPQQIHEASNGDILVAGLSTPEGIYRYDASGNLLSYTDVGSIRGLYELQNGNILFTSVAFGVVALEPSTGQLTQIASPGGSSWQFIEAVTVPEPTGFHLILIALPALYRRKVSGTRRRSF